MYARTIDRCVPETILIDQPQIVECIPKNWELLLTDLMKQNGFTYVCAP